MLGIPSNATLALLHRAEHWRSPDAIRADLELEAFREHHVRNILAMISANNGFIDKYIDGTLDKNDDVEVDSVPQTGGRSPLWPEQDRVKTEIVQMVQAGMRKLKREDAWQGQDGADDEEMSQFRPGADSRSTFAVLGPAGSGKTTAVHVAIEEVHEHGGRVLIVAPTGRLAATYRAKYPHLDVDTVHGAFMVYKALQETLDFGFDVVDVDADPALEAKYGELVPVLTDLHGEEICHYFLDTAALEARLAVK